MNVANVKKIVMVCAVALGMTLSSGHANAQVENMTASLETSSAITSNFVSGMDFGEYFINFVAADTPTLRLSNSGPVAVTQVGSVANGSQVVQITAPATQGVLNVTTPAPSVLQMTATNLTDFVDPGLALSVIRYTTATEASAVVTIGGAAVPVTVVAGNTAETVTFGGDIVVTATPADAIHAADFDVNFAY